MREYMTKPPKIVKEHRREFRSLPPPPQNRIIFPKDTNDKQFELYIPKKCMDKINKHCQDFANRRLEVMGFLVGDVYYHNELTFALVKDVISSELRATKISVRFEKDGFSGLFEKLENLNYDYIIVGWYHSHPGLGCFLSSKDIDTQKRMFNKPFHSALVVDPIKEEIKAYSLMGNGYAERTFAIFRSIGKL
jgi:proteasome lid subunit RPN8/RPN11